MLKVGFIGEDGISGESCGGLIEVGEVGLNVMSIGLDSIGGFGLIEEVGLELG